MIKPDRRSLAEQTLMLGARNTIRIDTPEDITKMNLRIVIPITVAAGAVPAIDGLQKLIQGLTIKDTNGATKTTITDMRALTGYNCLLSSGIVTYDTLPTVAGAYTLVANLMVHPGRNIGADDDTSAILNGNDTRFYNVEIQMGVDSTLGTGYTIGTCVVTPTVHRLLYTLPQRDRTDLFSRSGKFGVPVGQLLTENAPITSAASNLSFTVELSPARHYLRTLVMILDAAGERSDAVVSRICIKYPRKSGSSSLEVDWLAGKEQMKETYPNLSQHDLVGMYLIDWTEAKELVDDNGMLRTDKFGLNTNGMDKGEVVIGMTTTATGAAMLLHHIAVVAAS
ncbi:hypothetical protein COY26_00710 [Candidatus Woesearchaeota archaeon CG_4_10_14_0_2_um_filter_33_10]|nr:MAG: hypothetical protein COY26_00710 [Candidatus Woesearchaeota archaeon CG_4_10_14_0_2_um_filter_33_10]